MRAIFAALSISLVSLPALAASAWIGVLSESAKSCEGARIQRVLAKSPAERAGLKPDDCVSSIGYRAVRSPRDLRAALDGVALGEPVNVRFIRAGRVESASVSPAARPSELEIQRSQLIGQLVPNLDKVEWVSRGGGPTPRATIVAFGASWCGPCRMAEPGLLRVHDRFRVQGVRLVHMREDPRDIASAFAATEPAGLAVASDDRGEMAAKFFVFSLPTFVVVDQNSRVSEIIAGFSPDFETRLSATLSTILPRR